MAGGHFSSLAKAKAPMHANALCSRHLGARARSDVPFRHAHRTEPAATAPRSDSISIQNCRFAANTLGTNNGK